MTFARSFVIVLLALLCSNANSTPIYISMLQLIAFPGKYVGKEVILIGFSSDRAIFLTEEAAKTRDMANGIYYEDKREGFYDHCEEEHVRIVGKILPGSAGGIFLQDVSSIYSFDEGVYCEASLDNEPTHLRKRK